MVLDFTSPGKTTVPDAVGLAFFYKGKKSSFSHKSNWTNTAKMSAEERYKLYVGPYHPVLELVSMRLLSDPASSCERNWFAHGHIR